MDNALIIQAIVFVPVIGAFCLPLLGYLSEKLRNIIAFILILTSFVLSVKLIPMIIAGQSLSAFYSLLTADGLAVFMALVSSLIGAIIVLYSFDYIAHYDNRNEYYLMVVLFLGAMMGIIFSSNLIALYVFWEITALASWRLIGFFRHEHDVIRADKAFLVTAFGALLMLIGFITLYAETGSFDLAIIRETLKHQPLSFITTALILAGILSKSAALPFHTWLPDAGVAPSPVTALLHAAVLVKIGVYVFARLFVVTFPLEIIWHTVIPAIAATSTLISAGAAMIDTDIKRIIAYSTISQIGFIFLGLASGNMIGIAGGLLYILMHGLAKAGLFLCAGIIEQNTKTKNITKMGGLWQTMPYTALAFLFCSFSVMGIPPFGGFFSKFLVFWGAIKSVHPFICAAFLVGAFMTILYLFRLYKLIFLGDLKIPAKEGSALMVGCVLTLALLSLVGGLLVKFPLEFITLALRGLT